VVDVDDAEGAAQKFTFRGEAKPIAVPDTPPVALSGAEGDEEGPAAKAE
jgi:ATP-dependent Clp protease ATP-binding subunit ClpC